MEPTLKTHTFTAPGIVPYKYNPYSYLCDPKTFLEYVANKLDWEILPGAVFLDVGCGTIRPQLGEWLRARFPEMGYTVAFDSNPLVIEKMTADYDGQARIQFLLGNIEDEEFPVSLGDEWKERFDKVLSLNCFHLVGDLICAFDNLYLVTKPAGEIAVAFCLWSGFIEWLHHLTNKGKWDAYAKRSYPMYPCLQFSDKDEKELGKMIRRRGFTILSCETIDVDQPYETVEACKADLLKNALVAYDIPHPLQIEFMEDVFDSFETSINKLDDGRYASRSSYLMVLARKPLNPDDELNFSSSDFSSDVSSMSS